ncbi:MAG TPA: endoglucanase [Verrucomicrobia bacterium]|nr:endoglucanase [Verrucomicrobiota bacterium]
MDLELLRELCETGGVPGREERVAKLVYATLRGHVDSIETDPIGNVIAYRKGSGGPKLMLAGHMDEIGFIVTHVDENGFLRFNPLGGFDPKTLTAQRVVVHTASGDLPGVMGSKPIHIMTEEERKQPPKLEDYFIDLGLSKEAVDEKVAVGDVVTRERAMVRIGSMINSKSLDNRAGLFVMLEAVRRLATMGHTVELYAVATVQEELGLRGAQVAASRIQPQIGIGLDTTIANDVPGAQPHEAVCKLGAGAGIKIMDSSVVCDPRMVDLMRRTAQRYSIPHQMEILPRGGTDTAAMQRFGQGAITGCISIPSRYVHSVIEMISEHDLAAAVDLLVAVVADAHTLLA